MAEITKLCNACFLPKALSEFSKQKGTPDGLKYRCKLCDKRYYDEYYAKKAPEIIEGAKEWQAKNPLRVASHKQKYRDKLDSKTV